MAVSSDRTFFLEAVKSRSFTLREIADTFNVSVPTARNWSKLPQIEQVPGSYPHSFRAKGTESLPQDEKLPHGKPPKAKGDIKYVDIPNAPDSVLQDFLDKVIAQETPVLNFNEQFLAVDNVADLDELIKKVKSALAVSLFYREQLVKN